jgi:hypothetical protein
MDDITGSPSGIVEAPQAASTPGKRGRKSETPAQRLERLQRAVADAKIAAREAERRKCEAVGVAVLTEADADPQLKARLRDILKRRVSGQQARADIASLLRE